MKVGGRKEYAGKGMFRQRRSSIMLHPLASGQQERRNAILFPPSFVVREELKCSGV